MNALSSLDRSTQLGRAVGWKLEFPDLPLTLSHATHYGRIDATLPNGLEAGNYRIEIEALNTADFRRLAVKRLPGGDDRERPIVKARLTLFWRDRVGDDPSPARAPVTAVIAVTGLSRVAEGVRIKTVIEAKEWIHETLARAQIANGVCVPGPLAAMGHALTVAGLSAGEDFVLHPATDTAPGEGYDLGSGEPVLDALERFGERIVEQSHRRGRSIFLIREGVLHAGAERPIPFAASTGATGTAYRLGAEEGLIKAENQGERRLTAAELRREAETDAHVTARDEYLLTVVGRPDVKPGDVVEVQVEGAEAATFGGFGLPALPLGVGGGQTSRQLYISSVQHRLGKNQGWVTLAKGITVDTASQPDGVWDVVPAPEADTGNGSGSDHDSADPAEALAHQVRHQARAAARARERPRAGEIRASHQQTEMSGAAVRSAGQSVDVLIGLVPPDGAPRRARRQDIRRTDDPRPNVPYLTPFAWGPYGLVLPHYPGERVFVSFHEDSTDDPVVLGSFWRTADDATTSSPQNVEAGDWWLILPADVEAGARSSASGTDPVAPPSNAKSVHDLIDASGARVIQMKELTIRTLPADDLESPQTRPEGGAEGGILITHNNGAKIHIDADGKITIEAPEGLKLKSDKDVEIEGNTIKLKASSVDVVS